jgi:hypothetical protein
MTILWRYINPLNTELNPIYDLLALLEAHHIFHVSRIRVNWDKRVLIFADLFPDWDLENWQIVMQMNLITKLLEQLMCTL